MGVEKVVEGIIGLLDVDGDSVDDDSVDGEERLVVVVSLLNVLS